MTVKTYVVVDPHVSEYPEPICLTQGDVVSVGEEYEGPEGWAGWYLCSAPGQQDGWVPGQIIELTAPGSGVMKEDYSAKELDTAAGDRLTGSRLLNGWLWATHRPTGAAGHRPGMRLRPGVGDRAGT